MPEMCPIIRFEAAGGEVEVQACTSRAIRVRFFGPPVVAEASYVGRESWPVVASADAPADASAMGPGGASDDDRISLPGLTLQVDRTGESPRLSLFDGDGRRLLGSPARGGIVREE